MTTNPTICRNCCTSNAGKPKVPPAVRSRKRARQIVTTFHKLTKEADELAASKATDKQAKLKGLERELEEMGGRQAYQSASLLSVSFHNTSKWVTQQLAGKMGLRPGKGEPPLRVLEVTDCLLVRREQTPQLPTTLSLQASSGLLRCRHRTPKIASL